MGARDTKRRLVDETERASTELAETRKRLMEQANAQTLSRVSSRGRIFNLPRTRNRRNTSPIRRRMLTRPKNGWRGERLLKEANIKLSEDEEQAKRVADELVEAKENKRELEELQTSGGGGGGGHRGGGD